MVYFLGWEFQSTAGCSHLGGIWILWLPCALLVGSALQHGALPHLGTPVDLWALPATRVYRNQRVHVLPPAGSSYQLTRVPAAGTPQSQGIPCSSLAGSPSQLIGALSWGSATGAEEPRIMIPNSPCTGNMALWDQMLDPTIGIRFLGREDNFY